MTAIAVIGLAITAVWFVALGVIIGSVATITRRDRAAKIFNAERAENAENINMSPLRAPASSAFNSGKERLHVVA